MARSQSKPTLNELFRAINFALGIRGKRQTELVQGIDPAASRSLVSGFNRHPKDNRYRHVTHSLLLAYCKTLAVDPDFKATTSAALLQEMVNTLASGQALNFDVIDEWERISESLGNGPIWQNIHKSESGIRE